jgi:hypothetical protein
VVLKHSKLIKTVKIARYNMPKPLFNSPLKTTYAIMMTWGFSRHFQ